MYEIISLNNNLKGGKYHEVSKNYLVVAQKDVIVIIKEIVGFVRYTY